MSTNNFSFNNILVVIPDFTFDNRYLDEECEHFEEEGIHCEHVSDYYDFDTEGYKMYISDIQSQLEKIGFGSCNRSDNNRNYTGNIIASWSIYDKNDNRKDIEVIVRNGYYEGSNIDYTISEPDYEYTETKTMKKKIESKIRRIEKVLRGNGTEMLKVGQFSNGGAVYKLKK